MKIIMLLLLILQVTCSICDAQEPSVKGILTHTLNKQNLKNAVITLLRGNSQYYTNLPEQIKKVSLNE